MKWINKHCWTMFRREHDVSVDRMICEPTLRIAFLESVKIACPNTSERDVLWMLMSLRKRKEISKK